MNKKDFISTHERSDLMRQLFQHQDVARNLFMEVLRDDDQDLTSSNGSVCKYHKHTEGRTCPKSAKDTKETMAIPSNARPPVFGHHQHVAPAHSVQMPPG